MMNERVFIRWMSQEAEAFKKKTHRSAELYARAQGYLPGGDTRTATFFDPYPIFTDRGEGCRFYDVDGNVYLDFLNNYTALIHGHAHPAIVRAVSEQLVKGASYASPTKSQQDLAELICERVKSVEQVRFCNSGTEATMNAIRTARILTGRSRIVKMEGGYHGTHDLAEVSYDPSEEEAGPADRPRSVPENKGVPKSVLNEVLVVPFNNKQATESIVRENSSTIACLIVEPMLGAIGCICPEDGYLPFLRSLTKELGIFLIFDEVVTFRLGPGGAQGIYGVKPDLTAFGKIIGGGFPTGAFGGPKEIMKIFSPRVKGFVPHSGTFNGNPVTVAAGIATLKELTQPVYDRINRLGDSMRVGINEAFKRCGIKGSATGAGSLSCIHFNVARIRDYRSAAKDNFQAMTLLHMMLLRRGINVPRRGGELSISTPMGDEELSKFLGLFEECLLEVKNFLEEAAPHLLI